MEPRRQRSDVDSLRYLELAIVSFVEERGVEEVFLQLGPERRVLDTPECLLSRSGNRRDDAAEVRVAKLGKPREEDDHAETSHGDA